MVSKIRLLTAAVVAIAAIAGCAKGDAASTGGTTTVSETGGEGGSAVVCGDGVTAPAEACDDGDIESGDGCSSSCKVELGYSCAGSPSKCTPSCGNGAIAGSEECDDGDLKEEDGCSAACTVEPGWGCKGAPSKCSTTCGDGLAAGDEACDDHNAASGDGCTSKCVVEEGYECPGTPNKCVTICGDGIIAGDEACDDGDDPHDGDGCSAACEVETGFDCGGEPSVCASTCGDGVVASDEHCDDANTADGDGCDPTCDEETGFSCAGSPSVCATTCSDGITAGAEACDDGNTFASDGCSPTCTLEPGYSCTGAPSVCSIVCGDGVVAGAEQCDDGDTQSGDGCSALCKKEPAFTCSGSPSVCVPICGDGIIKGVEQCDDGDTDAGDGCSATCVVEAGYQCAGAPSACAATCGDGVVAGAEQCDDGNIKPADGCSSTCMPESGFLCQGVLSSTCDTICGDGVVVGHEQCDDGNAGDDDCCSHACFREHGCELEPNDLDTQANDFGVLSAGGRLKGVISPANDVDLYELTIPAGGPAGNVTVDILDGPIPGDTCTSTKLDTLLTVLNQAGQVLATNDDISLSNFCSWLILPSAQPGVYFIEVQSSSMSFQTYSYTLRVSASLSVCGNGAQDPGEQCDDSNEVAGDGCSASCMLEGNMAEVEPNDTFAAADLRAQAAQPVLFTQSAILAGAITQAGDKDLYKVQLAQGGVVRVETFDQLAPFDCMSGTTLLRVFDASGAQLYSDLYSGIGQCSAEVVTLAAGTYYVGVEAMDAYTAVPAYYLQVSLSQGGGAEVEPNDSAGQANGLAGTEVFVVGGHQVAGDSDNFAVVVPAGKSLRAEVIEGGTETCESLAMDTRLTLYAPSGVELADDDDGGRGYCSLIDGTGLLPVASKAHNLGAGTYRLQVRASTFAQTGAAGQFDYRLVVTIR